MANKASTTGYLLKHSIIKDYLEARISHEMWAIGDAKEEIENDPDANSCCLRMCYSNARCFLAINQVQWFSDFDVLQMVFKDMELPLPM